MAFRWRADNGPLMKNNNTGDPLTCDVPLMYIMYMLTSARETGSCQVSSFGTSQIILADVLSVIPVQTCVLGAQKNRLIGTVRRFF